MKNLIIQLKNSIIELLKENNSVGQLPALISQLSKETERLNLKQNVVVSTALQLELNVQKLLETGLKQKFSNNVDFEYRIDSKIKGGLTIKIGDKVYDYSLKRNIEELEKIL